MSTREKQSAITGAFAAEFVKSPSLRKAHRPRSISEQIADEVGSDILDGVFGTNRRVGEQDLAERFQVSRGPVRDAIRILEKRGLVEIFPRRGAFAVEHSLTLIADMFNVQATLTGLVARCYVMSITPAGIAEVETEIAKFREMDNSKNIDIIEFTFQSARIFGAMKRHCKNEYLVRIMGSVTDESLWDFMWRRQPLDYLTKDQRSQGIAKWEEIVDAARDGDDKKAEGLAQQILYDSHDNVLETMKKSRPESISADRLLTNSKTK